MSIASLAVTQFFLRPPPMVVGSSLWLPFFFPNRAGPRGNLLVRKAYRVVLRPGHTYPGGFAAPARILGEGVIDLLGRGHDGVGGMTTPGNGIAAIFRSEEKRSRTAIRFQLHTH